MSVLLPATLGDALVALAAEPASLVLAGGTDVMVAVSSGQQAVTSVVSLRRVRELAEVVVDRAEGTVRIGAGVTHSRLLEADLVAAVPALAQAARTVGSPQIRNAGTLGGNLATASPAGDTLPVLLALDASVELARAGGRRVLPVRDLLVGPKETALAPGELIVAVRVPIRRGPQSYRKVGVRNAMVIAVASVALVVDLDARTIAVGLGSVGPSALRAEGAEAWLADRLRWSAGRIDLEDPDDAVGFAARVRAAARPIDDHRGSAAYRRHAVGVLAARCLREALR